MPDTDFPDLDLHHTHTDSPDIDHRDADHSDHRDTDHFDPFDTDHSDHFDTAAAVPDHTDHHLDTDDDRRDRIRRGTDCEHPLAIIVEFLGLFLSAVYVKHC